MVTKSGKLLLHLLKKFSDNLENNYVINFV